MNTSMQLGMFLTAIGYTNMVHDGEPSLLIVGSITFLGGAVIEILRLRLEKR